MNIQFTNDFTAIANSGDAQDVEQTAKNMMEAVREMIEAMYPLATVTVTDSTQMRPSCMADDFNNDADVADRVICEYSEAEFAECWA